MIGWLLLLGFALLGTAVLLSRVTIRTVLVRAGEDDYIGVTTTTLYGLLKFKFMIPTVKWKGSKVEVTTRTSMFPGENELGINKDKVERFIEDTKALVTHVDRIQDWMTRLLKLVHIEKFRWETQVGLGDAMSTAITAGLLWGLKSSVAGVIHHFLPLGKQTVIQVYPVFNRERFSTEMEIVVGTRIIMMGYIGILLMMRVLTKENGLETWLNVLTKRRSAITP